MTKQERLQAEQEEINLLNGKGFDIKVNIWGKDRNFKCRKLSQGLLLQLSEIFITMEIDEQGLSSEDFAEQLATQYQSVYKNAKKAALVVATCITGNKLLRWYLANCILNTYTPQDLLDFAQKLLKTADYTAFIASIALMNGNRPTKAMTIE
ncbi:MAG: hypothetical protein ACTTJM_00130 [Bergeyella cardium]